MLLQSCRTLNPRSIVGVFQPDPAPDSGRALRALEEAGKELMQGGKDSLPEAPQLLDAAANADELGTLTRGMLQDFRSSERLPVEAVVSRLKGAGLREVTAGEVYSASVDESTLGMYGGSECEHLDPSHYPSRGSTYLARVTAYQKANAGATDPGLVSVDYRHPGLFGPTLKGTVLDGLSGSKSLFFVSDLSQVQGLQGKTVAPDGTCKERLETLLTTLDQAAPLQLHSYSTGYGQAGTYRYDGVRVDPTVSDQNANVRGAAVALQGVKSVLQVPDGSAPSDAKATLSVGKRMLAGFGVGAAAGILGTTLAQLHPASGAALAGLAVAGFGALGYLGHRADERDFALPDSNALQQRQEARARRGLENGLLLGATTVVSAASGAVWGLPGVAAAAGVCAAVEGLLGLVGRETSQA